MAINVNTKIYDKAVDRAAMIRLYERRVKGKISTVIDGHEVRINDLISEAKLSKKGYLRLKQAIGKDVLKTFEEANTVTKRSLLDLVSDQASYTYQNLETSMGKIWKTKRPQRRIAENIVLEKPLYSNKTLEQGWKNIAIGDRKRIERVIRKGMAEGLTPKEIALNVRKGAVHKITRNQSNALVTTSITSVHAQTDHAVYKANEKALEGWQYVAVLDARTSDICSSRDGTIYKIDQTQYLPPAHYNCRSTTIPIVKAWDDLGKLEGVAQVRKRNLMSLTPKQIQFYDGQTPLKESYNSWLLRQKTEVQLRHLGDYKKVEIFNQGKLHISQFTNAKGNSLGIKELRTLTDNEYLTLGDTQRFAIAREKLDAMKLGATSPDDFISSKELTKTLQDYYLLQAGELDGTLSLTNYRGVLIGNKRQTKRRVLANPPRDDQVIWNPITRRYEDARIYHPNFGVYDNNLKLINDSVDLLPADKKYIKEVLNSLSDKMGVNEKAAVADNLRILFSRYRKKPEVWTNFKAVSQAQIKFDVMNVSDALETNLRKDKNILLRLKQDSYIDPLLGPIQLQDIHDTFHANIRARNLWQDRQVPKIARKLQGVFDYKMPRLVSERLNDYEKRQFYLRFAKRLARADMPDRDQFAIEIGRDMYNMANLNGSRNQWWKAGMNMLEAKNSKRYFEVETYGVQKRRMKSRMSGKYFGPYYDTLSYNLRITDPNIQKYATLNRKIELGLRTGALTPSNRLLVRENSKTYWMKNKLGLYTDTREGITSTSSFSEFPEELIDKNLVDALNWTGQAEYRVDDDFYDFMHKLIYFEDDRGRAKYFHDLNEYRHYITSRDDFYERFKAMEWLRKDNKAFSNTPFIDHRARIYDRGLIGPQSGESYRPFLNTAEAKPLTEIGYLNLQDQVGNFLGGLDDFFEGRYNSLSITGRQKIAAKWRPELVKIGNHMLRSKPNDIRSILENPILARIDGEEQAKFLRFAIEQAKIDNYLNGDYSKASLARLADYKTALALEQDASSSGAQIIALTTRNKQLAELSNVIPTTYKKRLYDEIAAATYNDPRFRKLNEKLGLTEKDLRKASKYQNMVTLYGAGERTGIFQVEKNLAKALGKQEGTLVVTAGERDAVLSEISARMARYQDFDLDTYEELKALRENVREVFNKGLHPGDDLMEELYFLDSGTRDFVEKMSKNYIKVITPEDFRSIAKIMSEHLSEQVPILKDFTKYFGRLAEDFLINANPAKSNFDWKSMGKITFLGKPRQHYVLPPRVSELLGLKADERLSEKVLRKFGFYKQGGTLYEMIHGVKAPVGRRTGHKYFKMDIIVPDKPSMSKLPFKEKEITGVEFFYADKMPKSWTNVPWQNFDGKTIENYFTQRFEQRLNYKSKEGEWIKNIIQVPQKTEATWWEQAINKTGKINDIADATKARTAFAVNGNHSNDAVLVKKFHLWGKKNNIPTSTIHDAFFGNTADMLKARKALRQIYAETLRRNIIEDTLNEMRKRGLPYHLYKKYLDEAKDLGLIPIPGRSRVGDKILREEDILNVDDILKDISDDFKEDFYWYGVG